MSEDTCIREATLRFPTDRFSVAIPSITMFSPFATVTESNSHGRILQRHFFATSVSAIVMSLPSDVTARVNQCLDSSLCTEDRNARTCWFVLDWPNTEYTRLRSTNQLPDPLTVLLDSPSSVYQRG